MFSAPRARIRSVVLTAGALIAGAFAIPAAAAPGSPPVPSVHPVLFASAPTGATKPDDITKLGHLLYVTYQNNAGADGSPSGSVSTIVAFNEVTGDVVTTYTVTGRCD